jgi:predicted HicB family RNase H-like nuclease
LTSMPSRGTVADMKKRRADTREGMVTFTVALVPELHRRLAIAAVEDRAAIVELVREAIDEWLVRRARKQRPSRGAK